jgi:hypothetical protein
MLQIYDKWSPVKTAPFPVDLESLYSSGADLQLILFAENQPSKKLSVRFSDVCAYRSTCDEFRSHFWHEVRLQEDHAFFLTENSEYLIWFHHQSDDEFSHLPIRHFAIWTTEYWIDILSVDDPQVSWI